MLEFCTDEGVAAACITSFDGFHKFASQFHDGVRIVVAASMSFRPLLTDEKVPSCAVQHTVFSRFGRPNGIRTDSL